MGGPTRGEGSGRLTSPWASVIARNGSAWAKCAPWRILSFPALPRRIGHDLPSDRGDRIVDAVDGANLTVDERRARIHDDLQGVIEGDLLFEPLERAPYARDASLYEIDPAAVVVPRTEADVINTVRFAAENGLPVHARGAGTGKAGGAIGPGLVLDFSRYLRAGRSTSRLIGSWCSPVWWWTPSTPSSLRSAAGWGPTQTLFRREDGRRPRRPRRSRPRVHCSAMGRPATTSSASGWSSRVEIPPSLAPSSGQVSTTNRPISKGWWSASSARSSAETSISLVLQAAGGLRETSAGYALAKAASGSGHPYATADRGFGRTRRW